MVRGGNGGKESQNSIENQSDTYHNKTPVRAGSEGFTDGWRNVDYAMAGLTIVGASLPLGIGLAEFCGAGTIETVTDAVKNELLYTEGIYTAEEFLAENQSEINQFVSETISSLAL